MSKEGLCLNIEMQGYWTSPIKTMEENILLCMWSYMFYYNSMFLFGYFKDMFYIMYLTLYVIQLQSAVVLFK